MDKNEFLSLLKSPDILSENSVNELKEIILKFPSSQLPHFILARYYHHTNHPDKENYIRLASAYAPDRKILKGFIQENVLPSFVNSIPEKTTFHSIVEERSDNLKTYETDLSNTKISDSQVESLIAEKSREEIQNNLEELRKSKIQWQESEAIRNESQSEQLVSVKEDTLEEEFPLDESSDEDPEDRESTLMLDYIHKLNSEKDNLEQTYKRQQDELIERFIKSQPSIVKAGLLNTSNIPNQEDLSERSIKLDSEIVSENLAVIMARQGKIEKAIDIYKKLIWKYPQKKVYFATRIEELKK